MKGVLSKKNEGMEESNSGRIMRRWNNGKKIARGSPR